jgi:hypothetical protein
MRPRIEADPATRSFHIILSRTRSLRQAAAARKTEDFEEPGGAVRGTRKATEIAAPDDKRLDLLIPL